MKFFARANGRDCKISVEAGRDHLIVRRDGAEVAVVLDEPASCIGAASVGDRRIEFGWRRCDGVYLILIQGIEYEVAIRDPETEGPAVTAGAAEVRAPIPGLITRVLKRAGEKVKRDEPVLHLDAMKLENEIAAPHDGVMKSIEVRPGQSVEKGQILFVVG